ncbi:hypothetical protein SteCoe_7228 [Stentor coeruleus]|uniref:Uncharacterized protein n=1 Tax=Stentor coeruleus TaxID=5963 RepID=A0A1R2CN60_9CILI|nr:hypothetical protein SteCoe_7228 [Stentor coeruleus]
MPKITQDYVKQGLKEDRQGQMVIIVGKQISSFEGISSFVNASKLYHLDLSFNMIRNIPPINFPNLQNLDLSTNLITKIENLQTLTALQVLRLSRNRLSKIEGLESNINLNALDLSMNQISRIENISHLRQVKLLYLYGNSIATLEGIKGITALKELRIEQNQIVDLNHLATFDQTLEELEAHSNNITNLDEIIVTLSHLPKLKKLSLFENPIATDVTYRFRILKYKNIENLDGLLVKEYIREVLEDMEEDYDLNQVVIQSQNSINELIDREREVKETAIKLMKVQINQLEDDFVEFSRSMETELENLNEYAAVIRTKKNLGEDIAKDLQKVIAWREMIDKIEKQKIESIRQRNLWLEQERKNYLNDKRANIDFTGKLLKISQEDPNLWREIKNEMYQKRLMDERNMLPNKAISMAKSSSLGVVKTEGQGVDLNNQIALMNDGMKEVLNNLGGQMARETEARLNEADSRVASKAQQKIKNGKDSKACTIF